MERTLIIVKHDGVARGLVGEIVRRFERVGLKLVASKMIQVTKHYPKDRDSLWIAIGNKTIENYTEMGANVKESMGTNDPKEIGHIVREWLHKYLIQGPVFACIFEGPHAVELVRQIVGHTLPLKALPGTIRGDFSYDSSYLANSAKRPIKNLIHASGNVEEAEYEVPLWFSADEIVSYKRVEEDIMR